jgi:hypothetical protein
MLFCVTIVGVWLGYQANWVREREAAIADWQRMGGAVAAGPAPWPLRILGAEGVARFEYGYLGFHTEDNPPLLVVSNEMGDKLRKLFPESEVAQVNRW